MFRGEYSRPKLGIVFAAGKNLRLFARLENMTTTEVAG